MIASRANVRRAAIVGLFAVTLAAPVALAVLVWRYGVDVPRGDEWDAASVLVAWAQGRLRLADLFAQHNEHRLVVARLVMIAFAATTSWNLRAELIVAPTLALLTLALLAFVGARSVAHRPARWTALAVSSLLVFSPVQHENWIWGLQHVFFVPGLCLAATLAIAWTRWPLWTQWTGAAAFSAIASFSVASGLLTWVLALPAYWGTADDRRTRSWRAGGAIWVATAALTFWVFFAGYQPVQDHPNLASPFSHPLLFFSYIAAFLGGGFAGDGSGGGYRLAVTCGVAMFVSFGALSVWAVGDRDRRRRALPWVVFGGYAMACAVAGAAARAGFGHTQALASRYTTFSLTLAIALAWLAALWWCDRSPRAGVMPRLAHASGAAVAATLIALNVGAAFRAIAVMNSTNEALLAARASLPLLGHVPGAAPYDALHPRRVSVRKVAFNLWDAKLLRPPRRVSALLMMPADSAAPDASRGSLEQVTQAPDGRLIVEGWARDLGPPGDADAVVLAWVRPDGASRVVVFCDLWHKRLPGEAKGHAARRRAWRGELGASAIPQRRAQLTAWALDARSGRAFRLDGEYLSTPAHLR